MELKDLLKRGLYDVKEVAEDKLDDIRSGIQRCREQDIRG